MKPWSKLQREIYKLVSEEINIQIHCTVYPMNSRWGSTDLPRYWITLDREIIWDYPKQFTSDDGCLYNLMGTHFGYPYNTEISEISTIIREYIDTPKDEIFKKIFNKDHWGLVNILRAADRRTGKRRLEILKKKIHNVAAHKVISARLIKETHIK